MSSPRLDVALVRSPVLLLLLTAALCMITAQGITFTAIPGEKKCFAEEMAENTRYELTYQMGRSLTTFVSVSFTGPGAQKMFSHSVAQSQTREVFTTNVAGDYTVCFNVNKKAAISASRLEITFTIEDEKEATFKRNIVDSRNAQKQHSSLYSPSYVQASYIEGAVEAIHRDYIYLKQREADMRNTNEDTNTRTWAFTIVTVVVVAVATWLRHYKLKSFLHKKKMLD